MVDSRAKGQRAEYGVRDLLRKYTNQMWERVPGSGGFGAQHQLKGDVYLPCPYNGGNKATYCIEIKHYADDVINSNLLRPAKQQLEKFWEQTIREAQELDKLPLLVFKKDRGQWLVATLDEIESKNSMTITRSDHTVNVYLFEDYLKQRHQELWQ